MKTLEYKDTFDYGFGAWLVNVLFSISFGVLATYVFPTHPYSSSILFGCLFMYLFDIVDRLRELKGLL